MAKVSFSDFGGSDIGGVLCGYLRMLRNSTVFAYELNYV